jgi:predicted nucleic acid-binding protein
VLAYFDSSALVKLLVEEQGTPVALAVWDGCDVAVSSLLAVPELSAALSAAARAGRLSEQELASARTLWQALWSTMYAVDVVAPLAQDAAVLAEQHALRGADAVHLASALRTASPTSLFVAWDGRLREAAAALGLALVPPA